MRYFATNLLDSIFKKHRNQIGEWGVFAIVPQLYDPSPEVSAAALEILHHALLVDLSFVVSFARTCPDLEYLCSVSNHTVLTFLSVPNGFQFLLDQKYLMDEFDYWCESGNFQYVAQVEGALQDDTEFVYDFLNVENASEISRYTFLASCRELKVELLYLPTQGTSTT